jgi:hypothetical protein
MAPNRPFPVDPVLTAIAIAYSNPAAGLINSIVLPPIPVVQEKFSWTEFPIGQAFTYPDTKVGRKGRPNTVEFSGSVQTASIEDYGLDDEIPQSDIDAAEAARNAGLSRIDPVQLATAGLTNLIALDREVRAAAIVQDPNNYSDDKKVTLAGTDQLSDYTNSDPYGVIDAALNGTLVYRANTIAMGFPVWNVIKRHPKLIEAVKGGLTQEGAISRQQFADLFEIPVSNLAIGTAWLNTAKKGQAVNLARVWGKTIACLYVDPAKQAADDSVITFGFTAELGTRIAGSIVDRDIGLQGGQRLRVGERVKEFVAAQDVGYLIEDAVE